MNKMQENLSRNDEQIRQIIGSLEKIDAPKDFDFQLKSKIANTKSKPKSSNVWRYFLIGVPSFACLFLIAFFMFERTIPNQTVAVVQPEIINQETSVTNNSSLNSGFVGEVKPVEETKTQKTPLPIVVPKAVDEKIYAKSEQPQNRLLENKQVSTKKPTIKENLSNDIAATDSPKPILPKGLSGSMPNLKINETETVFEIESLLKDLGVETANENGKLKVKSVKKNSSAERSGIKNDDIIDAIDKQKIAPKEARKKSFEAKSISISRDGKTLELKLQQ